MGSRLSPLDWQPGAWEDRRDGDVTTCSKKLKSPIPRTTGKSKDSEVLYCRFNTPLLRFCDGHQIDAIDNGNNNGNHRGDNNNLSFPFHMRF